MDPVNVLPLLERLDDAVDTLEESLRPLLDSMNDVASKLPLLDKAKLYVLMTYSIESMLFSALRLNSVNAKEHPIFKELARVRQYFEKIQNIESPPQKPQQTLNKEAALRFIRSDLADDKNINTKLSEMIAKERAKAALKTSKTAEKRKLDEAIPVKPIDKVEPKETADSSGESEDEPEQGADPQPKSKKPRKGKGNKVQRKEKKKKEKSSKSSD